MPGFIVEESGHMKLDRLQDMMQWLGSKDAAR